MFINGYSIALLLSSVAALFLILNASVTGVRVLLYWDGASDSREQILLESRTWLAALLVEFALILQILSLYLLVAAADSFSEVLVGAMCAAGALSANEYGLAALAVKLAGVFCYAFWIVLHRLDISSISFPLLRLKFFWLLFLIPLLIADLYLVFQYVRLLEPDIITSCCGIIFGSSGTDGRNLVGPLPVKAVVTLFYLLAFTLLCSSWLGLKMKNIEKRSWHPLFSSISGGLWLFLFPLALLLITSFVSSYIYGMPNHRCPFDILKKEYNYVGFLLYTVLLVATFSGASAGLTTLLQNREGLQQPITVFRNVALKLNILATSILLCIVSYYPLVYLWKGGQR